MKKVYLHGALGKRFGKTWDLNVSSPGEAIAAIFANNPEVEKYLNKKQQEGIVYGIKKSGEQGFTENKEFLLSTEKDLHVFPIAQGSGGFAVSLIMTAITTAAMMYVSKKIAEAMERDDETLKVQTKSYIFNGVDNRYTQGSTVPVGYGRLNIGSQVVSACNINYDYNSEQNKILNFTNGTYSLIPDYHKNYFQDLGPLVSCFALNVFDGSSKNKFEDPGYKYIKTLFASNKFGSTDGLYGAFEDVESQLNRFTNVKRVDRTGNLIGGYFYYEYNYGKGVNTSMLGNFDAAQGNWYPEALDTVEQYRYSISYQNAIKSSYVCIQSKPQKENDILAPVFYPITFSEESIDYLKGNMSNTIDKGDVSIFPIQVGERWRGSQKQNGVGWFKLESASVSKSIDLICEGEIDGFSDHGGKALRFKKDAEVPASPNPIRYEDDDYLQAVMLDNIPIKEINKEFEYDSYNINEYDIDVGMNNAEKIGSEDQNLLEPQYLFTAYTKEINKPLYGPRILNFNNLSNLIEIQDFEKNKLYYVNQYVKFDGIAYKVLKHLDQKFDKNNNYECDEENKYESEIVYTENNNSINFYIPNPEINEYDQFTAEYVDEDNQLFYEAGDKVKNKKSDSSKYGYYKFGDDADKFLGIFDQAKSYANKAGYFVMLENIKGGPNTNSQVFIITGDNNSANDTIESIGSGISIFDEEDIDHSSDFFYFAQNHVGNVTDENGNLVITETTVDAQGTPSETTILLPVAQNIIEEEVDITPNGQTDTTENLWNEIKIESPILIESEDGQDIDEELFFTKINESEINQNVNNRIDEENYLSHSIINPLVEEAIVSLQADELFYLYEGDHVEVTYEIGKLWRYLLKAWTAFQTAKTVYHAMAGLKEKLQGMAAAASPFSAHVAAFNGAKAAEHGVAFAKSAPLAALLIVLYNEVFDKEYRWRIGTKIENSGELWPNKARFRIKYGNEGEILYSTDIYMYGVATSAYRKDIKIYLPPNPDQKDRVIKVYKLNRERNFVKEGEQAARYKEKMSLASITEITPVQLNYPNSVIVGTRINAKDSPNMPKRTYNMRLKKVQVPTNYDPETRKYEGNWSGDFSPDLKWTDNPAWCLYDLISNKRFGVGKFGIKEENIDRWTLYKIAKYCDEYVPSGYSPKYKKRKLIEDGFSGDKPQFKIEGIDSSQSFNSEFNYSGKQLAIFYNDSTYDSIKIHSVNKSNRTIVLEYEPEPQEFECAVQIDYPLVEPRYTLNAYIMNQENAFKLINEFAAIFRSFAYWSGGAINFFQDEKKESVMLFSNNNISEEGFSYSSTPKTSRTNSCNIKYVDRYNMYRPKIERAEDREAVKENNMIEQSIDGFGITSQAQAKRAAEFVVKSANLETEILSFKTSMLGSYLKPGDVIDVLDNKRTIGRFAGKALDIKVDEQGRNAEVLADYPIHSFIDPYDKETWKNVTLYAPSGNETIASLDSDTDVTDEKIDSMRATQVGDYLVYDIAEDDRTMKLYNNIYEFVEGDFTWLEALRDAKTRSGQMAVIEDDVAQDLMSIVLPKDKTAWLGGYNREKPDPEALLWVGSSSCGDNFIEYENGWAEGFPKFTDPLLTDREDEDENIVTDLPKKPWNVSADNPSKLGNFIFASGSQDLEKHGKWMHMSGHLKSNYILQKTFVEDDYLKKLKDSDGTTFMMEDSVNFAEKKQYKVINITEDSDGLFSIQALQYNVDKFDNIEKDLSIRPPHHPVIFNEGGSYNE